VKAARRVGQQLTNDLVNVGFRSDSIIVVQHEHEGRVEISEVVDEAGAEHGERG